MIQLDDSVATATSKDRPADNPGVAASDSDAMVAPVRNHKGCIKFTFQSANFRFFVATEDVREPDKLDFYAKATSGEWLLIKPHVAELPDFLVFASQQVGPDKEWEVCVKLQ